MTSVRFDRLLNAVVCSVCAVLCCVCAVFMLKMMVFMLKMMVFTDHPAAGVRHLAAEPREREPSAEPGDVASF